MIFCYNLDEEKKVQIMDYYFGVDIGGTTVKIGLLNEKEKLVDKWEIKTNTENNGASILKDVADSIKGYSEEKKISKEQIKGIGFGVPGPIVGTYVKKCVNLGWENTDVKEEFLKHIDFEPNIVVLNDANAAAYGETMKGSTGKHQNAVMLTLGTGVGGSIVVNGFPIIGVNGAAGEFGHARVDNIYNFRCGCGRFGCLETVASATGVVRIFKRLLEDNPSSLTGKQDISCKDVFAAAKANDALALRAVDEVGHYLGLACSYLAATVDPEIFIIGGGVSRAGQILLDAIEENYRKYSIVITRKTNFALASLGNDGGMIGAALLSKNSQ